MNKVFIFQASAALGMAVLILAGVFLFSGTYTKTALPAAVGEVSQEEASTTPPAPVIVASPLFHYIEITNSCNWDYAGTCVNMRSGPGTEYAVVARLRAGMVLKVEGTTVQDGLQWYKIIFDGDIRYPERVTGDWYVAVDPDSVIPLDNIGDENLAPGATATTTKRIVIDLAKETLSAYDGDTLFMQEFISTGLELTPTPRGTFRVYKKTPSRYMQGPIPGISDQFYDLPGVPWNLYFTNEGAVIHGAYWHDKFGQPWSHGCVNLPPEKAKELYLWADIGMPVTVQD